MASKKKIEPVKPVVSRVPLPATDSALVIDLPDGQKLVVGKMGQGTVIEVATWRGVGRPDSRTSRMMFGMSSAEIDEEGETKEVEVYAEGPSNPILQILNYPLSLIKWLFNIQSEPMLKKNKYGSKKLIIETRPDSPSIPSPFIKNLKKLLAFVLTGIELLKKKASPLFSRASVFVKQKLKQKGKAVSTLSKSNEDIDIEKWLDSLNNKGGAKGKKEEPRAISAPRGKTKK